MATSSTIAPSHKYPAQTQTPKTPRSAAPIPNPLLPIRPFVHPPPIRELLFEPPPPPTQAKSHRRPKPAPIPAPQRQKKKRGETKELKAHLLPNPQFSIPPPHPTIPLQVVLWSLLHFPPQIAAGEHAHQIGSTAKERNVKSNKKTPFFLVDFSAGHPAGVTSRSVFRNPGRTF